MLYISVYLRNFMAQVQSMCVMLSATLIIEKNTVQIKQY